MRKIIVSTYMTMDGIIADPMWTLPYWADDIAEYQTKDLRASDALLLGRETYESFAEAWSSRAGADADEFTNRMNSLPKYVASRTLKSGSSHWNGTILQGDVVAALKKLKAQPGQNILKYGGGELLDTLVQNNLLDELHLLVYPVVQGTGARLFPEGSKPAALKLVDSNTFSTGVIALTYVPTEGVGS